MKVLSFGDLDLSDSSDYDAVLFTGYNAPDINMTTLARDFGAPVTTQLTEAPLPLVLQVYFAHTNADALRRALIGALDTRDGAKALVIAEEDDSRERFLLCHTRASQPINDQGNLGYAFTLIATGDNRWQATAESTNDLTWTETNTTQTVTNSGDLDAYPVITITPRQSKSTAEGFIYSRRVIFQGPLFYGYEGAPLPQPPAFPSHVAFQVDTATLVDAGKVVDKQDMALLHGNGRYELPFFPTDGTTYGFDTELTTLWLNHLNYQTPVIFGLAEPIAEDAVLTRIKIDVNTIDAPPEQITQWFNRWGMVHQAPIEGVADDFEIFIYEGFDDITHELLNVRRAQCGTVAAAHTTDFENGGAYALSTVNLRLLYGPGARIAEPELTKATRAKREPIIDLEDSDNLTWVYNLFKRDSRDPASSGWTVNRTAGADPFGIFTRESDAAGSIGAGGNERQFYPYNTLGFAAGRDVRAAYRIHFNRVIATVDIETRYVIGSSYSLHPFLPALVGTHPQSTARVILWQPTGATYSNTLRSVSISVPDLVGTTIEETWPTSLAWECNTSTHVQTDIQRLAVTFSSDHDFVTRFAPEVQLYDLRLKITNETTGESILVDAPMGETDTATVIDCLNHTAIHDGYDNIYGRVTRLGTDSRLRQHFLRLAPGSNTIRVEEEGLTDVDISIDFRARYYA